MNIKKLLNRIKCKFLCCFKSSCSLNADLDENPKIKISNV